MKIIARRSNGACAYPPIGKYIGTPTTAKSFEAHEIKDQNFVVGTRLRPEGARQPEAEARILANIRAIDQGRVPITMDIFNRG
jgi:hypothetical protein